MPVIKMTQTPVTEIDTHQKKIAISKSPWPIYVGKSKISWYCPFRLPTLTVNQISHGTVPLDCPHWAVNLVKAQCSSALHSE